MHQSKNAAKLTLTRGRPDAETGRVLIMGDLRNMKLYHVLCI